ncbi:MAG: secretin N-terminal domain-containing protein, partial [Planctomycetota bacterium]
MRTCAAALAVLLLCGAAVGQQDDDDKKIQFKFKEASLDAVIEYLSEVTPWTFYKAKNTSKKITAYSDTEVPLENVLDFLDTALKPAGLASMKVKNVVIVDDEDDIRDKTLEIRVGSEPDEIEISDKVVVQIIPLANVSVKDIEKELGSILKKAGDVAVNKHANVIVVSGRSQDIHRLARILNVVDAAVTGQLKVHVMVLKNSDAVEMAKILNEIFKKEQSSQRSGGNFMQQMMRMFGGRGRRRGEVEAEDVAGSIVRIVADVRTNAVIVTANEENIKLVEDVVVKLDTEMSQAMTMKRYTLQYADVTAVAKVIMEIFPDPSGSGSGGGGRRGRMPFLPPWMQRGGDESKPSARAVRAVAETRTNMLIVMAHENDMVLIDELIAEMDRQITDVIHLTVYPLENADATEMAKVLSDMFGTQASSSSQGSGGRMGGFFGRMFGRRGRGGAEESKLPPAEAVDITSDARTNSVIVKASQQYQDMAKDLIETLDSDTAAAMKIKQYTLEYADATEVATVIKEVFAESTDSTNPMSWMQRGRGRGGMRGMPQTQSSTGPKAREVRAVADTRTNMVIAIAHETDIELIDQLIAEMDRQMTDLVRVEVYALQNADAADMAKILHNVFQSQVSATNQSSRQRFSGQAWQRRLLGGTTSGTTLPPSEEVEITADERTNKVVVKASQQYQEIAKALIETLDADPTESTSTFMIPIVNHTAEDLAEILKDVFRTSSGGRRRTSPSRNQQQRGSTRTRSQQSGGRGRSSRGDTRGGTRRLGPLDFEEGQDELPDVLQDPAQDEPQEEEEEFQEQRRGVEGDVDIEADPRTNSLVIRTSPRNYEAIQKLVQDLDRMRPQVLIKVLIAEVTLTDDLEFGVEGFWENKMTVRGGDKATGRFGTDFSLGASGFSYL